MHKPKYLRFLPKQVEKLLLNIDAELNDLQEIKLRTGKPLMILSDTGEMVFEKSKGREYFVTENDIKEMLGYISNYSLYAYEEEMRQGFITIEGGHRIGLCGQVVMENGRIRSIRYVSSINVRIAHEVKGCADKILPYLCIQGHVLHTLIISPPRCGKTTLLRDIIRQISDGNSYMDGVTVGVVDERSEIGGCYRGVPQNQLGMRSDVLDGAPKADGMLMLIRAMGPQVIAVDEIGTVEDVQAVDYAMHSGCKMIASVHGKSLDEIKEKPVLGNLIKEYRFERYVVLSNKNGVGSVEGIYDKNGRSILDCGYDKYLGSNEG